MNINNGTYGGRLTRDVDVRFSENGTAIATIGMAINRRTKRGGEWVDEPVFVDVKMFGKRGEAFARHHSKGDPAVFPSCELAFDKWEDKQTGAKRSKLYLIASNFEFVPDGGRRGGSAAPAAAGPTKADDTPF